MALTMKEKTKVAKETSARYRKATKKQKKLILDEFVALCSYNRSYASLVLRNGQHNKGGKQGADKRKSRPKTYGEDVLKPLKKIWAVYDCICGKRLVSVMTEAVSKLEKFSEIELDCKAREKLLMISAATIDRLLVDERKKFILKGKSLTKPGSLLKHQIPIRTFADWNENKPGFVEIDLVGHEGGNPSGEFCQTLDAVDIATTWTETIAVKNKAQKWVFEAIEEVRESLPFDLLGIDSDNGAEFINAHLYRYCIAEEITFTRGRSNKKNDGCYVEQKNWSVVRRNVGYLRYDTEEQLAILNRLYGYLRLYTNFFQPSMKLISKERTGAKVKKRYDTPKTPYQRVLESEFVSEKKKQELKKTYAKLNPAQLKRNIVQLQSELWESAVLKKNLGKKST